MSDKLNDFIEDHTEEVAQRNFDEGYKAGRLERPDMKPKRPAPPPRRSFKDKVLDDVRTVIESFRYEAIDMPQWANTGKLSVQYPDKIGELGCVYYDFQDDTFKLSIYWGGVGVPSQPGREGYFDFYMKHEESGLYEKFRQDLASTLRKAKEAANGNT